MLAIATMTACSRTSSPSAGKTADPEALTVYSGQHEQTVQKLVADFEQRSGAKVALRSGDEGDLANQLLQEGKNSPADVYFAENPPALTAGSATKPPAPAPPNGGGRAARPTPGSTATTRRSSPPSTGASGRWDSSTTTTGTGCARRTRARSTRPSTTLHRATPGPSSTSRERGCSRPP